MSDFDEEAERERLREKYEQDQREREATERMSELLLQGATMTNAHCGECGDPIFRYDGQEFCPTCEKVVTEGGDEAAETTGSETDAGADGEAGDPTEAGAGENGVDGEDEPAAEAESERPDPGLPERRERAQVPDRDRRPSAAPRRPDPPVRREESDDRERSEPARESGGDLADARKSLRRSLVRFAREAERTEDPRRAREHLEAAREAAEALGTVSELRL